jgi:chaperonin GroEL (HSP60 family)
MKKLLVTKDEETIVTSDGVTILEGIDPQHPTANVMRGIARTMKSEVGDGTITAVILSAALLQEAGTLVEEGVHPTTIIQGYNRAMEKAITIMEERNPQRLHRDFTEMEENVALTAIRGQLGIEAEPSIALIIAHALKAISKTPDNKLDLDNIKIEKIHGGSVKESTLITGLVIKESAVHPDMPTIVKHAKILLVMCPMEILSMVQYSKWFAYPTGKVGIRITQPSRVREFLTAEKKTLERIIEEIAASGANCIFCFRGIDEHVSNQLAKKGILAFKRVAREDMEKLAKSTGATFISNWKEVAPATLGEAQQIRIQKRGNEKITFIEGCPNPRAVSIVIQGATSAFVDEAERVIQKGLRATQEFMIDRHAVIGGGSFEMELALQIHKFANQQLGRIRLAIRAFARALEAIPRTLAENAALNPLDLIAELRKTQMQGQKEMGVDVFEGKVTNMLTQKVVEPLRVKKQALKSATEAAITILRVDTIITKTHKDSKKTDGEEKDED